MYWIKHVCLLQRYDNESDHDNGIKPHERSVDFWSQPDVTWCYNFYSEKIFKVSYVKQERSCLNTFPNSKNEVKTWCVTQEYFGQILGVWKCQTLFGINIFSIKTNLRRKQKNETINIDYASNIHTRTHAQTFFSLEFTELYPDANTVSLS